VQRPQLQHIEGIQVGSSQWQQGPSVSHLASISQVFGDDDDVVDIPTPTLFAQQPIRGDVGSSCITRRQPRVLSANDDDLHIVEELDKLSSEWEACCRRYHELRGDFKKDVVTASKAIAADIVVGEVRIRKGSSTFWNAWKAFSKSQVPVESQRCFEKLEQCRQLRRGVGTKCSEGELHMLLKHPLLNMYSPVDVKKEFEEVASYQALERMG
jgi:hypothetical protein